MKVVVTGASGFIGKALARKLLRDDENLELVLIIRPTSVLPDDLLSDHRVKVVSVDAADWDNALNILEVEFKDCDVVHSVAGFCADWGQLPQFELGNVTLPKLIVSAVQNSGSKAKLIHVSTVDVYGYQYSDKNDELAPLGEVNIPYPKTKKAGELLVAKSGIKLCVIVRPATVYGPECPLLSECCELLLKRDMPYIGNATAGLIYIDDMVDLLILAAQKCDTLPPGSVYNACGEEVVSWKTFTDDLAAMLGAKRPLIYLPYSVAWFIGWGYELVYGLLGWYHHRPLLTRMVANIFGTNQDVNIDKAKRDLGFEQKVLWQEGLRKSIEWFQASQPASYKLSQ